MNKLTKKEFEVGVMNLIRKVFKDHMLFNTKVVNGRKPFICDVNVGTKHICKVNSSMKPSDALKMIQAGIVNSMQNKNKFKIGGEI